MTKQELERWLEALRAETMDAFMKIADQPEMMDPRPLRNIQDLLHSAAISLKIATMMTRGG